MPVLHQSIHFSECIVIINLAIVSLRKLFSFPCPVFISSQLGTGLLTPLFNTQGVSMAVQSGVQPYCTSRSNPCVLAVGASYWFRREYAA
jgi:hypothetical protein